MIHHVGRELRPNCVPSRNHLPTKKEKRLIFVKENTQSVLKDLWIHKIR